MARSYFHRGGGAPLLGLTIPEQFARVVERHGSREAVVCLFQDRRLNYADLAREVDALARGMLALGFGRGHRVGVWSTNNVEWLLLQLATARIGAILVDLNPAYRPEEIEYALRKSEVQGLFTIPAFRSSEYVRMLEGLVPGLLSASPGDLHCAALPSLRRVVVYDPRDSMNTGRILPGLTTWQEVIEAGESVSPADLDAVTGRLDPDDAINIQYTSGTTGFPKAVLLSHHNILNNAWFAARAMGLSETDRLCVPVPFYHCFGMVLGNLVCLAVGACVVIPVEHFEPLAVLKAVERERCTALHGVPTMFVAEMEQAGFPDVDLHSLRTGIMAGAPCPPALMKRVMEDMHCSEILIGYGQTEASPLTHLTERDDDMERRTETVGRNLPHQEAKVVDPEDGNIVPLGEVGEICFRGYHVMKGYYGDPEATAAAVDGDGWLHSGDLGTMDADGYVRITGRLKEMIIRGGENIYPAELERIISTHPKVAQVGVVGVPHERYGEEVMAWVQLHAGQHATEEEIREFCRGAMAHFKVPAHIVFVDEFPMTVTGKLQKFRMREKAVDMLNRCAARE
jgi:fatty-acyl-CoA synthase